MFLEQGVALYLSTVVTSAISNFIIFLKTVDVILDLQYMIVLHMMQFSGIFMTHTNTSYIIILCAQITQCVHAISVLVYNLGEL